MINKYCLTVLKEASSFYTESVPSVNIQLYSISFNVSPSVIVVCHALEAIPS